jgi:hypothetical protein
VCTCWHYACLPAGIQKGFEWACPHLSHGITRHTSQQCTALLGNAQQGINVSAPFPRACRQTEACYASLLGSTFVAFDKASDAEAAALAQPGTVDALLDFTDLFPTAPPHPPGRLSGGGGDGGEGGKGDSSRSGGDGGGGDSSRSGGDGGGGDSSRSGGDGGVEEGSRGHRWGNAELPRLVAAPAPSQAPLDVGSMGPQRGCSDYRYTLRLNHTDTPFTRLIFNQFDLLAGGQYRCVHKRVWGGRMCVRENTAWRDEDKVYFLSNCVLRVMLQHDACKIVKPLCTPVFCACREYWFFVNLQTVVEHGLLGLLSSNSSSLAAARAEAGCAQRSHFATQQPAVGAGLHSSELGLQHEQQYQAEGMQRGQRYEALGAAGVEPEDMQSRRLQQQQQQQQQQEEGQEGQPDGTPRSLHALLNASETLHGQRWQLPPLALSLKPFPWPATTLDLGATGAAIFFNLLLVYAFLRWACCACCAWCVLCCTAVLCCAQLCTLCSPIASQPHTHSGVSCGAREGAAAERGHAHTGA